MDKKQFVILVAVGTACVTTVLTILMSRRNAGVGNRRVLWVLFLLGVVALLVTAAVVILR